MKNYYITAANRQEIIIKCYSYYFKNNDNNTIFIFFIVNIFILQSEDLLDES